MLWERLQSRCFVSTPKSVAAEVAPTRRARVTIGVVFALTESAMARDTTKLAVLIHANHRRQAFVSGPRDDVALASAAPARCRDMYARLRAMGARIGLVDHAARHQVRKCKHLSAGQRGG